MRYFSSRIPNEQWVLSAYSTVWAWVIIAVAVVLAIAFGSGFVGWDDLHYLKGALRWLNEGTYIPTDHWEARLPYIISLSGGIAIFGPSSVALIVPNTLFFIVTLFLCWRIGLWALCRRGALLSLIIAATTPLFFRYPTTFYPESLETALTAAMIGLALTAVWNPQDHNRRTALLFAAGLFGGTAILVRETALAVPISVSLVLMWENRRSPWRGMRDIAWMTLGSTVPVACECFYFAVVTGNPLYRFVVDSHHVLIPSAVMTGNVFKGDSPLFNWKLGPLWNVEALFHLHWTVNPLINLFTRPVLLLQPWLGVAGAIHAWRLDGRLRTLSMLALGMLLLQYLINTFVLVLAPNPRYFADSVFVLCLTAGSILTHIRPGVRIMLLSAVLLSSATIATARLIPQSVIVSLNGFLTKEPVVYVSQQVADTAFLAALTNPALGKLRTGPVPVGGAAAIGWIGTDKDVLEHCETGAPRWEVIDTGVNVHSLPWNLLNRWGLLGIIPASLADYLSRDKQAMTLARRRC